jgi:hypothetical protein
MEEDCGRGQGLSWAVEPRVGREREGGGKVIHFQTVDLTKFMCSVDFNMGTISGTTHIKTIFSFSPGTGRNLIGNALCNSDDSVTQLIHILHFLTIECVYYKPQKKISSGVKSGERGDQGIGPPLPSQRWGNSLSREARIQRGGGGGGEWGRKLFPRGHDVRQCSPSQRQNCQESPSRMQSLSKTIVRKGADKRFIKCTGYIYVEWTDDYEWWANKDVKGSNCDVF